jgi:hypothetical protein
VKTGDRRRFRLVTAQLLSKIVPTMSFDASTAHCPSNPRSGNEESPPAPPESQPSLLASSVRGEAVDDLGLCRGSMATPNSADDVGAPALEVPVTPSLLQQSTLNMNLYDLLSRASQQTLEQQRLLVPSQQDPSARLSSQGGEDVSLGRPGSPSDPQRLLLLEIIDNALQIAHSRDYAPDDGLHCASEDDASCLPQ